MKYGQLILSIACLVAAAPLARALESGAMIPCATPEGPFATYAVVNAPLGTAFVTGNAEPDLFVRTTRFGIRKGLYLYQCVGRGDKGEPIFAFHGEVGHPFEDPYPPAGAIVQTADKIVHGLWPDGDRVRHCVLNVEAMRFEDLGHITIENLPRGMRDLGVVVRDDRSVQFFFGVGDGVQHPRSEVGSRSPEYDPYNGRGIWRWGHPYASLYTAELPRGLEEAGATARHVSQADQDVRIGYYGFTPMSYGANGTGIITGSHYGNLYFYKDGEALRKAVVGSEGIALRHPSIHPGPVVYGGADIVAAGEGGFYWYRFTGSLSDKGNPVYDDPVPVLERGADLYTGTLPVVNTADWDGDGDQDLIVGNSEGFILFFKNSGDNRAPRFMPGVALEAGGAVIHIQPGYGLDIQGPGEARWGYVCPTVVDWDQDGDLDIVMSDSTARHTFYENVGSTTDPRLAAGQFLYYDGLELYGTWRVQPGAGLMNGRMAYVALDADDAFHLYWQEDAHNVTDGFKLRLATGEVIQGNFLDAGGTGRLKIVLVDWDRDGVKDLVIGTPRHGSVPDPENGLPQSLGLPGAAMLFMKNVGTESDPQYNRPELFAFRGKPIYLGQHACSPGVVDFGNPAGPDLIAGHEAGRLYFYSRSDLTTLKAEEIGEEYRGRKD